MSDNQFITDLIIQLLITKLMNKNRATATEAEIEFTKV